MAPSDVQRLAAGQAEIAKTMAALEATVKTEFEHTNKRLDSHSTDIKNLGGRVEALNICIAKSQAINGYKEAQEEQASEDRRDTRKFFRQAWFQIVVSIVLLITGSVVGPLIEGWFKRGGH